MLRSAPIQTEQNWRDGCTPRRVVCRCSWCNIQTCCEPARLILVDWSLAAFGMHELDSAVRLAQEALQQAETGGSQAAPARAYDILSLVARKRNDLGAAIDQAEHSLASAHAATGSTKQAIALLQAALDLCMRLGDRHREAALRNNLADLYHASDQSDAAMDQLKQAVDIIAEVGAEAGPGNAEIWMLSEW
jgi:tetratricopeptide (TPR) repeat protein